MRSLLIMLFGISLLAVSRALAEETTEPDSVPSASESDDRADPTTEKTPTVYDPNRIEWFALRFIFGTHGAGTCSSFITLRWRYIYASMIRSAFAFGGRDWHGHSAFLLLGGSQIGLQFPFGERRQHEFRFGAGIMGGLIVNRLSFTGEYEQMERSMSHGPVVDVEINYIYHFKPALALEIGVDAFLPTTGLSFKEGPVHKIPTPALMGFVGLRF